MGGVADLNPVAVYLGEGSRGPFPFVDEAVAVPVGAQSHVQVQIVYTDGDIDHLTAGVHYDLVSVVEDASTGLYSGSVLIRGDQPALAEGERLVIWREAPIDQDWALEFNKRFPSESFTRLQNKVALALQDLRARIDRAPLAPVGDAPVVIEDRITRKGKVLGGDPETGELRMLTLGETSDTLGLAILHEQSFVAEADQDTFVISGVQIDERAAVFVWVGGAIQPVTAYSLSVNGADTTLLLAEELADGTSVVVRVIGARGVTDVGVSDAMTPVVQGSIDEAAARLGVAQVVSVKDPQFGARGDLVAWGTGAMGIAGTTVTISGHDVVPLDAPGKKAWIQYAAGGSAPLVTDVVLRISPTQFTVADANASGQELTNLIVYVYTDDTEAIDAWLAATDDGWMPEGLYAYSGDGWDLGDGDESAPSTRHPRYRGARSGTGDLLAEPYHKTAVVWVGEGILEKFVRYNGPGKFEIENIDFLCGYRADWGWDLKHVIDGHFRNCNILHAREKGVKIGAYENPAGCYSGASMLFENVRPRSPGVNGYIGFDTGEEEYNATGAGLDVARVTFRDCEPSVANDPAATVDANGYLTPTAATSYAWAFRMVDNVTIEDCFGLVAGERLGASILIAPASGDPVAGFYPSEIIVTGRNPMIGGIYVDETNVDWTPGGRGLDFDVLNDGDMMDPSYDGAVARPTPEMWDGEEGVSGRTSSGLELARYQIQSTRAGIGVYTQGVIEPRVVGQFDVTNTADETDIFVQDLPKNIMRVFNRLPAQGSYVIDRELECRVRGSFQNNTGGAVNGTLRAYVGNATDGWTKIFDSAARSFSNSANFGRFGFTLELQARNSLSVQDMDAVLAYGVAGSGGSSAALRNMTIDQSQSLTLPMTKAQQLRVTFQWASASSSLILRRKNAKVFIH